MDRKEYERQWRKRNPLRVAKYHKTYFLKHRQKEYEKVRKWRAQNPELAKQRDAKYRAKYRAKITLYMAGWRKRHPEYNHIAKQKEIAKVPDWYVRARLSRNTQVKPEAWPDSIVELSRTNIKLKRLCRNRKTSTNSENNCSTPSIG